MIIGVPKEIKKHEYRVALIPSNIESLVKNGHSVLVEHNAGLASNFPNEAYLQYGAQILHSPQEIYAKADMIVKVKEPQPQEYPLIRPHQILFTFFHFAANPSLTQAILKSNCIALAYETIELPNGSLPLLTPMSEVAGRMSIPIGATYLQKDKGGRGILLGGVPGVHPATVLIIGAGTVGAQAARMASALNANTFILDINLERLRYLNEILPSNVTTMMSNPHNIRLLIKDADLTINSTLIPGAKTPKLITRETLRSMKPHSVIIDVAIDQGGGLETSRPTDHDNPTYIEENIIHYCVTNMPGVLPITSTIALTNATFPYILLIANLGLNNALQSSPPLLKGLNISHGKITLPALAHSFTA